MTTRAEGAKQIRSNAVLEVEFGNDSPSAPYRWSEVIHQSGAKAAGKELWSVSDPGL